MEQPDAVVSASGVERALRESRGRFESAFQQAPIGMALIAMDGRWLQVNDALCQITGFEAAQLLTLTLGDLTHAEGAEVEADALQELLAGGVESFEVERRLRRALGDDVWVLLTTSLVRDPEHRPMHRLMQVQDISERKALSGKLEHAVDHDHLTGLHNRRHFERALSRETERARRYGVPGALLLLDIDHFKRVNDEFGHRAGDDVLKGVAGMLRLRLRQTDLIARVGGDEFAVLLPQTDLAQVQIVAEDVVRSLARETAQLADRSLRITASIGAVMLDGLTDGEAFACADVAMYEAKEAGRNRVEMYRPLNGGRARTSVRLAEADRIRRALLSDELLLYAQPIRDLRDGQVKSHEILVRLPAEDGGEPLLPARFLYRAEQSGLIQAMDGWVVHRAIRLIEARRGSDPRVVLHVNLSGRSVGDQRFAQRIEDAIDAAGIDPSQLVFELTETAAISQFEDVRAFVARLHARGCRFALDDFGAGFGSFHYLKNFPFDYLKIDGDFVRDIVHDPTNRLVVSAIVGVARGMGMETVAEFVIDEETVTMLRTLGVDHVQGFHVGRPVLAAEGLGGANA